MVNTTAQSAIYSWSRITNMLRITSREAYTRDLDLTQRMQYIHKLTHGTSTTGPQRKYPTNRVSSCLVHLAGEHLSSSPLHVAGGGGWGLTDDEAKCRALLLYLMWTQIRRDRYNGRMATLLGPAGHVTRIPRLEYLLYTSWKWRM